MQISCSTTLTPGGSNNKNAIQNSILAQVAQQDIKNAMSQKGLQNVDESKTPDLI